MRWQANRRRVALASLVQHDRANRLATLHQVEAFINALQRQAVSNQVPTWQFIAGLRHSSLKVHVDDRFLVNGNDSGSVRYANLIPVAGITYKVTPALNLYASAARGSESPALNEMFYSGSGEGFNFALRPARNSHFEVGAKSKVGPIRADAALFKVLTTDELLVHMSSGGRTSYRNGGRTQREGIELSLTADLKYGLHARLAANILRATYREGFGAVAPGNRLPGVAGKTVFGELGWRSHDGTAGAAVEMVGSGKIYAEDSNTQQAAPGYVVSNLRMHVTQRWAEWEFRQFIRINNLSDHKYVGSLIVGDSSKRYYEAAPGRTWQAGFRVLKRF